MTSTGHTLTDAQRSVLLAAFASGQGCWAYGGSWFHGSKMQTARICDQLRHLGLMEGRIYDYTLTPLGREWAGAYQIKENDMFGNSADYLSEERALLNAEIERLNAEIARQRQVIETWREAHNDPSPGVGENVPSEAEDATPYREALSELVRLDGEAWATGGGPGYRMRYERAWDEARDLVRNEP